MSNNERAGRIEEIIETSPPYYLSSPEEALIDLLTDARHYAQQKGLSFEESVRISGMHFDEELTQEA